MVQGGEERGRTTTKALLASLSKLYLHQEGRAGDMFSGPAELDRLDQRSN